MKKLLAILILSISAAGCGMISDNCDGDVCYALFGEKNNQQDDKLAAQKAQLQQLEINNNYLMALLELYEMQLQNGLLTAGERIDELEIIVAENNADIVTLQNNVQITALLNPCGDTPNVFDEILLQTSAGLIASFSDNANGKNTRFSVLTNGTYMVTDGTNCVFTVQNGRLL